MARPCERATCKFMTFVRSRVEAAEGWTRGSIKGLYLHSCVNNWSWCHGYLPRFHLALHRSKIMSGHPQQNPRMQQPYPPYGLNMGMPAGAGQAFPAQQVCIAALFLTRNETENWVGISTAEATTATIWSCRFCSFVSKYVGTTFSSEAAQRSAPAERETTKVFVKTMSIVNGLRANFKTIFFFTGGNDQQIKYCQSRCAMIIQFPVL